MDFCHCIPGEEVNLPVYVIGAGTSCNRGRGADFPHRQLVMCKQGEGTIVIDEKEHIIKRSQCFYIPPNCKYECIHTDDCWKTYWIAFDGVQSDSLLKTLGLDSDKVFKLKDFSSAEETFLKIRNIINEGFYESGLISSSLLYGLLIELNLQKNNVCTVKDETKEKNLAPALEYINEHFAQDIPLENLVSLLGFSAQYICRLFKENLNLRPFEYIARVRIKNAKKLILNSNLTVNEISEQVGYSDSSYFCAIFKRYEKISPAEFRQLYKKT